MVELDGFFVEGFLGDRVEGSIDDATGKFLEPQAAWTYALCQTVFGEGGKFGERMDTPQVQNVENFRIGRERVDGEGSENFGFVSRGEDGDAGEMAGSEDGGFGGGGDGDPEDFFRTGNLARSDGEDRGLGVQ